MKQVLITTNNHFYHQAKQHVATPNSCICTAEHCWKSVC